MIASECTHEATKFVLLALEQYPTEILLECCDSVDEIEAIVL